MLVALRRERATPAALAVRRRMALADRAECSGLATSDGLLTAFLTERLAVLDRTEPPPRKPRLHQQGPEPQVVWEAAVSLAVRLVRQQPQADLERAAAVVAVAVEQLDLEKTAEPVLPHLTSRTVQLLSAVAAVVAVVAVAQPQAGRVAQAVNAVAVAVAVAVVPAALVALRASAVLLSLSRIEDRK